MTSKGKYSRDGDRGRRLQVSHTAAFSPCPACGDRVIEYLMSEHLAGCSPTAVKLANHMRPGYVYVGLHGRGQPLVVLSLGGK